MDASPSPSATISPALTDWLRLSLVADLLPLAVREQLRGDAEVAAFWARPQAMLSVEKAAEVSAHCAQFAGSIIAAIAWQQKAPSERWLLCRSDPLYPPALQELRDAPPLLYVQGDAQLLSQPQIAIVGSRTPTPQGRDHARAFAETLARAGLLVTSGLAQGIDAAAHEGALLAGPTLAVIGTGIDRIYPAGHKALAHTIAGKGALISELPMGTPALRHHFPRRNRLIANLSLGTLVVEAALSSGSLITARQALDAGRAVFAIPGSVHNPLARGCHALIRQGATLVETAADVLQELQPWLAPLLLDAAPAAKSVTASLVASTLDDEQQALLAAVGDGVTDTDTLIRRTGFAAEIVASMLLTLEMNDHVASVPGGWQRRYLRR